MKMLDQLAAGGGARRLNGSTRRRRQDVQHEPSDHLHGLPFQQDQVLRSVPQLPMAVAPYCWDCHIAPKENEVMAMNRRQFLKIAGLLRPPGAWRKIPLSNCLAPGERAEAAVSKPHACGEEVGHGCGHDQVERGDHGASASRPATRTHNVPNIGNSEGGDQVDLERDLRALLSRPGERVHLPKSSRAGTSCSSAITAPTRPAAGPAPPRPPGRGRTGSS